MPLKREKLKIRKEKSLHGLYFRVERFFQAWRTEIKKNPEEQGKVIKGKTLFLEKQLDWLLQDIKPVRYARVSYWSRRMSAGQEDIKDSEWWEAFRDLAYCLVQLSILDQKLVNVQTCFSFKTTPEAFWSLPKTLYINSASAIGASKQNWFWNFFSLNHLGKSRLYCKQRKSIAVHSYLQEKKGNTTRVSIDHLLFD